MNTIQALAANRRAATVLGVLLTFACASPAHAFRCGNKLVIENMHEYQVRNICGAPATERHLGFVLRSIDRASNRGLSRRSSALRYPVPAHVLQEVAVTEFVYNFGPRKFMQRLVFEGGVLVTIEAIGYGYRQGGK